MSDSEPARGASRTSSGSWGPRRAPDIIDLDHYMRGSLPVRRRREDCERLVVDGGGLTTASTEPTPVKPSSSTTSAPRDKRYSHDSGLSDGSYVKRRTHRRPAGDSTGMRAYREREREVVRAASATSMRSFRAACTRALKEQQEQIARVAQLCEKLTRTGIGGGPARKPPAPPTQDSSISSSSVSLSTRNRGRKDKNRTDECKTYKIIMTKLDELNRLFAARARRPPRTPSNETVSVSDKIVATETPPRSHMLSRGVQRKQDTRAAYTITSENRGCGGSTISRATRHSIRRNPHLIDRGAGAGCNTRVLARLTEASTDAVDIAPDGGRRPRAQRHAVIRQSGLLNVATDSVMQCESIDGSMLSKTAPLCQFDLDDPLHIYAQVKRMQQLNSSSARRRTRSMDNSRRTGNTTRSYDGNKNHIHHTHGASLCSLCRGYWRALTTLANQLFGPREGDDQRSA